MKNRRTSFLNCLVSILWSIPSYLILMGLMQFNKWAIISCILLFLIISSVMLMDWYSKTYRVYDDIFILESGIISKKVLRIPVENIVSVDTLKSVKQRLVGLNNLKINITNESEDLSLVLSNKALTELLIFLKVDTKEEDEVIYRLSGLNTLIFSAYHTTFLSYLSVVISFGVIVYGSFSEFMFSSIGTLFFSTALFFATSKIILIVVNFFRFKDFKIVAKDKLWKINMGTFHKSSYSLNFDRISAVSITDTVLLRHFNKCSISVSVCGMGKDENNACIVLPIIDKKEFLARFIEIFPNYAFEEEKQKISPKHKLHYQTTRYGISKTLLYLEKGILKKRISIIKKSEIDSISYSQNFINRKRKTYKLRVNYAGRKIDDLKCVNGVESDYIEL